MRLIKPSIEILEQGSGIQGIYKQIERAGRTCYKSEDHITEDSAEKFVNMIKDRQHTAMLEHGTVYLYIHKDHAYNVIGDNWVTEQYLSNSYSVINIDSYGNYHITTNYRVLYENDWLDDLKYLCEPTEYHEKRITVKFICDRGVSHEFVRHRVFSFAQEVQDTVIIAKISLVMNLLLLFLIGQIFQKDKVIGMMALGIV